MLRATLPICVLLAASCSKQVEGSKLTAEEMGAIRVIKNLQESETKYYAQHGKYAANFKELGLIVGDSKHTYILNGTEKGFTIQANLSSPAAQGWNLFSDQSLTIHQRQAPLPATASDPEVK